MNKRFILMAVLANISLFSAPIINAESSVFTNIGAFSNMKATDEHQYGIEVRLWKEGTEVFGTFCHSEGLIGDTPIGYIEEFKNNSRTGKLSFKSKLTTGSHYCKIHEGVPARDLYIFQGKISNSSISGMLEYFDGLHPEKPPVQKKILLVKMESDDSLRFKNRSEWQAFYDEVMKFRGPKW